jgi:hypothetical protein
MVPRGTILLRTHKTRPVGGVLLLVSALVLSLCVEALGTTARADDTPSPDPSGTSGTTTTTTSDSGLTGLGDALVTDNPAPQPDRLVLRRGLSASINVAANDRCSTTSGDQCTYALGTVPTGWAVSLTPGGVMSVRVPARTVPRAYIIGYTVANHTTPENLDHSPRTATSYLSVAVTPDSYTPRSGMTFTHPYRKRYRNLIRTQVVRTINSVPTGAYIQIASWSFASKAYRNALTAAKARGVAVQIVLAQRNKPSNSDYRRLVRRFGTTVTTTGSWVRKCRYSCRGTSGTMHAKMFLFSTVYRTPYVEMTGSANLTDFAVSNQWNQMNTVSGNKQVYDGAVRIFTQMYRDTPARPQYVEETYSTYPGFRAFFYPRGAVSPANDFILRALAPVRCRGAVNAARGGRTIVKIAMYAWYQQRGKWLAKRVRQLWDQGCQVQIVFAISSNPVKKILYSPSGRGRIPMRQILLTNRRHVPIYYLHDKWVAITGNYAGNPSNSVSFQGSFNFSDLGFSSDEQFQMIPGRGVYNRFARDFGLLWKDRQARAPSPISMIPTIEGRYTQDDLRLGRGKYRYMDAD